MLGKSTWSNSGDDEKKGGAKGTGCDDGEIKQHADDPRKARLPEIQLPEGFGEGEQADDGALLRHRPPQEHVFQIHIRRERKKTFEVAYQVHENDPDKSSHLSSADTEEDVVEWEEAASSIKLSQLIDHYVANAGQSQKLPSLTALRKEMLEDKYMALAKYEANTFSARPLNDPRFDSVVVIYTGEGSLGSGFFVKPDTVLTNWHVVEDKKFVELKMYDGQETFGKTMVTDVRLDLALIKVQRRGNPVQFYTGKTLDLGATVEAIGHPKGLEFSITRGVISALRSDDSFASIRTVGGDAVLLIQTDAPINKGNSGGPLFLGDKVIGVNAQGGKKDRSEGLNFAIHYSEVLNFLRENLPGFVVRAR